MDNFRLTSHALDRLRERSVIGPDIVLSALKNGRIELITVEQYSNRGSYLYFSDIENTFFVLVIDISTQEVVTILPIEYWENLKAPERKSRFLNWGSITKSILFKAIRRVDSGHEFIVHPPLFGRDLIYFFISYYIDGSVIPPKNNRGFE